MKNQQEGQPPSQDPVEPKSEMLPSIQLIPEAVGTHTLEGTPLKRDKRGGAMGTVNNFIQKTYAILQEKQF